MKINNKKTLVNQERRLAKKKRINQRKQDGTYKYTKAPQVINKWGKPYYELIKKEVAWKYCTSKNSKTAFWLNPVTHELLETYDVTGTPDPHVIYVWESTGKFADIKADQSFSLGNNLKNTD